MLQYATTDESIRCDSDDGTNAFTHNLSVCACVCVRVCLHKIYLCMIFKYIPTLKPANLTVKMANVAGIFATWQCVYVSFVSACLLGGPASFHE